MVLPVHHQAQKVVGLYFLAQFYVYLQLDVSTTLQAAGASRSRRPTGLTKRKTEQLIAGGNNLFVD